MQKIISSIHKFFSKEITKIFLCIIMLLDVILVDKVTNIIFNILIIFLSAGISVSAFKNKQIVIAILAGIVAVMRILLMVS